MGEPFVDTDSPDEWLTTIGDIAVSEYWISTPTGQYPIRGTVWTVTDMSTYEERLSTTALILALVCSLFCLLGLLFLLMKDVRPTGFVQVMVEGNGFCYSTMIPVMNADTVLDVNDEVDYARELAGRLA
jgi:hypothetical protein